jgi:mutator protein MutT
MPDETLVLPNVYGLIKNSAGEVLIQRRWKPQTDPDTLGMWELPGGKWRAGESAQDCLRRELREECGLELRWVDGPFARHEHLDQQVETSTPLLMVQMLAGPYTSVLAIYSGFSDGKPATAGDGARDAQFVNVADLKQSLVTKAAEIHGAFVRGTERACREESVDLGAPQGEHSLRL